MIVKHQNKKIALKDLKNLMGIASSPRVLSSQGHITRLKARHSFYIILHDQVYFLLCHQPTIHMGTNSPSVHSFDSLQLIL